MRWIWSAKKYRIHVKMTGIYLYIQIILPWIDNASFLCEFYCYPLNKYWILKIQTGLSLITFITRSVKKYQSSVFFSNTSAQHFSKLAAVQPHPSFLPRFLPCIMWLYKKGVFQRFILLLLFCASIFFLPDLSSVAFLGNSSCIERLCAQMFSTVYICESFIYLYPFHIVSFSSAV